MSELAVETRELLNDFADEAIASLESLPELLAAFRQDPQTVEPIHAVFRAVHSIKGNASFFGLTAIKTFSHSLENTLDDIRKEQVALGEELERALVEGIDRLNEMVQRVLDGECPDELGNDEKELLDRVGQLAAANSIARPREDLLLDEILKLADELHQADISTAGPWAERIRAIVESYRDTDEAQGDRTEAGSAPLAPGTVGGRTFRCGDEDVTPHVAHLAEALNSLGQGTGPKGAVVEQFSVAAETLIGSAERAGQSAAAAALRQASTDLATIAASPLDLDEGLLSVVWDPLVPLLADWEVAPPAAAAASEETSPAGKSAERTDDRGGEASQRTRLVRVKEERLDEFLGHVSSLFITCELFKDLQTRMSSAAELTPLVEEMRQINRTFADQSTTLQKSIVALRRVNVGGLFSKFPRMARSLAAQLDKKIDVQIVGGETEIDKTLIEDLDAPLTHMIRNVVDHGIETPAERRARGASETGTLWLKAEQTRTHVRIIIQDDGRGIDPRKLRDKAVEKGVLSRAQADALNDEEALDLVFHAGFSTAAKLSDISGRGVGLDVVRTMVREHNGEVAVESQVGVGTTFQLEFPLRDAVLVIDGLMVRHDGQDFVVPFEFIREITELDPSMLHTAHGSHVVTIRGETYDAISLSRVLGMRPERPAVGRRQALLVGSKFGSLCLLADEVRGHRQVVVNSLQEVLPCTDTIAGVSPLGGGRLALVLSVPDIVRGMQRAAAST